MATDYLALRGGYVRDNSPILPEYLTPFAPDSDRNEFTGGIGYKAQDAEGRGYHIDAAVRYVVLEAIDSTFAWYPASYDTTMTFFALSFGYSF
jgi:long-subunit fatty acid transport protein